MLPMDLSSTVKNAALSFESLAFEYEKQFTMEIQDGLTMNGNEGNIRQLVTILLDNAFKYSGEHSTVSISLPMETKKYFWSAIQEMESLQRTRSIFSNVSTEVKPIVTVHKGQLTVKSDEATYTAFTATFL